jgi:hypothetical protein
MRIVRFCPFILAMGFLAGLAQGEEPADVQKGVSVSPAEKHPNGVLVHSVRSPYQTGTTKIRVLVPDRLDSKERCRTLYVLPVEAGDEHRYGDGLEEVRKLGLHNKHRLVCVAPTFSHLPWYADHESDRSIRQETYFLRVVLPAIEQSYPVRPEPGGRLLLGFSKSGWGAFTLLLRHPDVFGRAAAWDAPLTENRPAKYGMGPIFGSQENFQKYEVTRLLAQRAEVLRDKPSRLVLTGYGSFRDQSEKAHRQMVDLKIPHLYRDGPPRKHDWHSGWVGEAVGLLME